MNSSEFDFTVSLCLLNAAILLLWAARGRSKQLTGIRHIDRRESSFRSEICPVIAGICFLLAAWFFLSASRTEGPTRVPSPFTTFMTASKLIFDGTLPREFSVSVIRIIIGFSLASVIGTATGWVAGSFALAKKIILPSNSFVRYIPPTAFVFLMVVYFGVGEPYKYAVVFVSVVFFIVQMIVDVVEDIDRRYLEMGLLSGMSQMQLFRSVIIPATLPRVVDVLRINLSGAWTFLVAAEIVGADGGLGHLISISQRFGRIENLYVAILTFGLIGVVSDVLIGKLSRFVFRWK